MGAQGTATLNFGAWPGQSDASVDVTGQAGIVAGSLVEAWILPPNAGTTEHSHDEHVMATEFVRVVAGNIVAGTGFTIYGIAAGDDYSYPNRDGHGRAPGQSESPRVYGQLQIAWCWN